jgi:DNA repair exonuclease SbcCD ATPase subunit
MATKTKKLVSVPTNAQIRVDWQDYPENRTLETINRVKSYFSNKYGVPKTSIKINFSPIIKNNSGKIIDITDGLIDNIMDSAYQRSLFKEWLNLNEVTVDYDRLCKLDERVNEILLDEEDEDIRYRRWSIKDIWLDNFLSFGDGNKISYKELNGLTVVKSLPANQGGKTIFTIDTLLFLFFGKTTKTDVGLEIFNQFRNNNTVCVGANIEIDGEEYIIERKLLRKLSKSTNKYKVSTSLDFYKILEDGSKLNLVGEQRRETDKLITDTIGSYDDFMLTIVATSKNLEDLIETKPTYRGRLVTKFIGLEVIEKKESINKDLMSNFKKKMKSNIYDVKSLEIDIEENKKNISLNNISIKENNTKLEKVYTKISDAKTKKDNLLTNKYVIDDEITNLNPINLNGELKELTSEGKTLNEKLNSVIEEIKDIPKFSYDEDEHENYREEEKTKLLEKNTVDNNIKSLKKLITELKEGEICPMCKRSLDDVDHSSEIKDNEKLLKQEEKSLKVIEKDLNTLLDKLTDVNEHKNRSDLYDKLNLKKQKTEVEVEHLRVEYKEKNNLLKSYEKNKTYIDKNREIESKILGYKQLIETLDVEKDNLKEEIQNCKNEIKNSKKTIDDNKKLIIQIKKEGEVLKIFDVYNRMIGKNGISKLVLSSVIPIINYELSRLLDEVCDFDVQLNMNDKNEVEFLLIKNDTIKKLKSGSGLETTLASLSLRCVLGRISTLPKPNVIVFDEVLGKVADVNLEQVKIFFEKIKEIYETILLISHNTIVQDWSDKIITIEKNNDVSTLQIK